MRSALKHCVMELFFYICVIIKHYYNYETESKNDAY